VDSAHPSARLFDIISGMMRTQTIAAIAELGVADAIADGVTGTDELAREVGADADALRRMLRLLEADGLVSQDAPGVWRLSAVGELLREGVEGSMRQLAMLFGAELYQAWAGAATSVRTGEPAFAAHFGSVFFDWLQQHPVRGRSFDRAMSGTVTLRLAPLLERDWSGVETVVDVGGGNGMLIEALLTGVPGVRGITFDLPQVSERAASRLEKNASLRGRVSVEAGDFFDAVPPGADVYVLAQVLHDWADDDCVRILEACRRAGRPGTRLLVLEQILPEGPEPNVAKLTDLNMLVLLGGRERTRAEFERLLAAGGWSVIGEHPGPRWSALEAAPARE
jgi:SAM-dependent methyltransferase